MSRNPALDGLRGVAVLLVLFGHFHLLGQMSADIGVTIFFALSGYLITNILMRDLEVGGRVRFRRFYLRRARRLFPALFSLLLVALLAGIPLASILPSAFYFANYVSPVSPLAHTWSLAVEEQFYFLWPLALFVLWRFGFARWGAVTLLAVALGVHAWSVLSDVAPYTGFAARSPELLFGCCLALWKFRAPQLFSLSAVALLAGIVLIPWYDNFGALLLWGQVLAAALTVVIISNPPAILSRGVLVHFGVISYGLYLWHWFLLYELPRTTPVLLALLGSWVIAAVSFEVLERRFTGAPSLLPKRATKLAVSYAK